MTMVDNICGACDRQFDKLIGVVSSSLAPYSFSVCQECLIKGAEPRFVCDGLIEMASDPNDLCEDFWETPVWDKDQGRYRTMADMNGRPPLMDVNGG